MEYKILKVEKVRDKEYNEFKKVYFYSQKHNGVVWIKAPIDAPIEKGKILRIDNEKSQREGK